AYQSLTGVMAGLIAWLGFCMVYVVAGQRFKAAPTMLVSMVDSPAVGVVLKFPIHLFPARACFCILQGMIGISLRILAKVHQSGSQKGKPIPFEIGLRMLMITGFVLLLTYSAQVLGPTWSGILTPFPVITAVLAVFTHFGQGMKQ